MTVIRFFVSIVLFFPTISIAKNQFFSIENVSIAFPGCTQVPSTELQFACHRFGVGKGFGVALRKYWPPKGVDDAAFEKLTIYFQVKPKKGQNFSMPTHNVFAYFSSGQSSFPGKHGCYGMAHSGTIKVDSVSNKSIQLHINLDFDLKSPLGWVVECKKSTINMTMKATEIKMSELDAWYGKQGPTPSIWDESKP